MSGGDAFADAVQAWLKATPHESRPDYADVDKVQHMSPCAVPGARFDTTPEASSLVKAITDNTRRIVELKTNDRSAFFCMGGHYVEVPKAWALKNVTTIHRNLPDTSEVVDEWLKTQTANQPIAVLTGHVDSLIGANPSNGSLPLTEGACNLIDTLGGRFQTYVKVMTDADSAYFCVGPHYVDVPKRWAIKEAAPEATTPVPAPAEARPMPWLTPDERLLHEEGYLDEEEVKTRLDNVELEKIRGALEAHQLPYTIGTKRGGGGRAPTASVATVKALRRIREILKSIYGEKYDGGGIVVAWEASYTQIRFFVPTADLRLLEVCFENHTPSHNSPTLGDTP